MKYLILCPSDKRIVHISTTLNYNKVGGLILDSGLRVAPGICEVVKVDDIPSGIKAGKYCYIENQYVLNERYVDRTESK